MKTRRQVSAGGVLVRRGQGGPEVLLASRRTRRGDLVWGLPKGLVEAEETPEEAAVREVREETGWTGTIRQPLGDVSYWFVWGGSRIRKTVHFFLMDAAGEAGPRDHEMEEVAWFPLVEAADVAGFDSEKDVIRRAADAAEGR
ncbi:MAG TPA: NUDIX domain-containing protein [Actinomycetota bacterium]|nr:NUDIX domain-containing protein [Actinomycetota bacterium]